MSRSTWGALLVGVFGGVGFVAAGGELPSVAVRRSDAGGLLPDTGPLEAIVIQYTSESAAVVVPTYRALLAALPAEVTVYALVPDQAAYADLCARLGPAPCRPRPVVAGHPITAWSRDRWLAVTGADGGPVTLLSPRLEDHASAWSGRAGDQRVAEALARALPGALRAVRSRFEFDGGDFVADDQLVVVTPRVAARNVPLRGTRAELVGELERTFGRRVLLLDEAPDHHAGMFLALTGERTALVADPALGAGYPGSERHARPLDRSPATQARFDAVAGTLAAAGYRVLRMPVWACDDGRTFATPVNAILDARAGERIVYMPVYAHAPELNAAAAAVWRAAGYVVRPIDCSATYVHFGSLRCLVNVLGRGTPGGTS